MNAAGSMVKLSLIAQVNDVDATSAVVVEIDGEVMLRRISWGDDVLFQSMGEAVERAMVESLYGPVKWISNRFGEDS